MTAAPRIVVVGGGVLGTSAAARIAETGRGVALVTDAATTTRVSAASFAWVNANAHGHPAYAAFKTAARSEHRRQGIGEWFVQTGSDSDGIVTEEDGYVDVERFIAAHRQRLVAAGGAVHAGAHVQRIHRHADKIILECNGSDAAAERIAADTVVLAAGTGIAELSRSLGADTRRIGTATGTRGFLARVQMDQDLTGIRSVNGLQLRPDGPGILAAQSLPLERLTLERAVGERGQRAIADSVWEPLRREIGTALERDVPPDALVRIDEAARPMPADGRPVVGWVADGVYALLSHSGITLAPLLAELVAGDLSGADDGRLAPYRPDSLIA